MAKPPTDVPARELFLKLTERPAPSVVVDFPRLGDDGQPVAKVRVFCLPQEAHDRARLAAHEKLGARGLRTVEGLSTLQDLQDDAVARELVCLSVHEVESATESEPPKYRRVFRNAEEVGAVCTADEVHSLFTAYLLTQRKFGPYEASFQDDSEVNEWILRLQEGGRELPLLSRLNSVQRDTLLLSLVQRAFTLSQILECPSEALPMLLESIPETWRCGTYSHTGPVAESTLSLDDVVAVAERVFPSIDPE